MSDKTLPDQIADFFIALIFVETLKAGDKLPPERQLAELLQVDRTSLRTALKILIRMNLMQSIQGSGITILDMREHAGVDMLDNVLRIPQIELGSDLLINSSKSFIQLLPMMFMEAFKSHDQTALKNVTTVFQHQLDQCKQGASASELATFDTQLQDFGSKILDQPLMLMIANSSRRVRHMLMAMLYEHVDRLNHFEKQLAMVNNAIEGTISLEELEQQYRVHIQLLSESLIAQLETLPKKSYLRTSPLQHLPDSLSIPEQ